MAEPIRPVSQAIVNDTSGLTTGTVEQQQDAAEQYVEGSQLPIQSDGLQQISIDTTRTLDSSISSFLAQNQYSGFAKANRIYVSFNVNTNVFPDLAYEDLASLLSFKCEMAEFPGREFVTSDARIYGPTYKSPSMSSYGDANFTLICDSYLTQKHLFEIWMSYINPPNSFDFNYRDDYVCDISIYQYNEINKATYLCTLREAYPVSVTALQGNWGDDQIHKLQVTMTYRYWVSEISEQKNQSTQYEELRQSHILRVQNQESINFREVLRDENLEHLRRINRTNDESKNRFRRIINELTIEE